MPSTPAARLRARSAAIRQPRTRTQRGQILVLLVLSIFVLMGFIALVIDVSWYWSNSLRIQRAADSAALAGAVDLPGAPSSGTADALAEAKKNGYVPGGGVTISAVQDGTVKNQMDVTISAPVNTFFMRIFGIQKIQSTRSSKALFTLPVPMGSPENYYGNFGVVRNQTFNGALVTTPSGQTTLSGPGAVCANGLANCFKDTGGQTLNPRGFWATMNTEGANNVDGDAFQPFYDTATSSPAKTCGTTSGITACYDPTNYYNYAISMPPNTTGGRVFVFDPTFCATDIASGTGDRWFGGNNPVSSWYELFNTNNTPYDNTDDTRLATSGTLFEDQNGFDSTMNPDPTPPASIPSGATECKQVTTVYKTGGVANGLNYHDSWYLLYSGLTGGANGTVYRLHTTGTLPPNTTAGSANQKSTDGEQSFAIFADDTQGTTSNGLLPTVYGLGAMQMFTPLSGTSSSTFYLAQVPNFYAGKTLELSLWDPGDTSPLSATLSIQIPTAAGWSNTPFTYSAVTGTTNGNRNNACNSNSSGGSQVSGVQTSTGASLGLFNGCWLTMDVPIPANYTAQQNGWWKILYSMNGSGTSQDVTTWTAQIIGNPVHLIVP